MAKKDKKKNNRRKLLLLVILLALTVVLLSTASYAWFISNKTVNVDSLDVNARTANGLEISADAEDWGVSITKSDLISASFGSKRNQLPSTLDHVSTVGAMRVDNSQNLMQMFDGNVEIACNGTTNPDGTCDGEVIYTLTASEATNEVTCYDQNGSETVSDTSKCNGKNYVAFDVFLKVTSDAYLKLGSNANVKKKGDSDFGIQNATRVAFLYRGHVSSEDYYAEGGVEAARALNAAADDAEDPAAVYIWEPNYDAHTRAGINSARDYYGVTVASTTGAAQVDWYGINQAFDTPVNLTATNTSDYVTKVAPDIATESTHGIVDISKGGNKLQLKAGVTKLRVYFWVEGQDVDAENNATGHDMQLNLEFTIE